MADYPSDQLVNKSDYEGTALDYAFLRSKAIELVQQYSGQSWTDFNLHDPGVTILEYLCYAITDLAYRARFPIIDLLADEEGKISRATNAFFSREQILSTSPITSADFRKFIIDAIPEVNNVWIQPILSEFSSGAISGRYKVILQIWQAPSLQNEQNVGEEKNLKTLEKVRRLLGSCRNIAEDFSEFIVLKPQPITVNAQILINRNANPEETLAKIYYLIQKWLSPPTDFFTEKEMLLKGYPVEAIYSGPLLHYGIIPDHALSQIRKEIDPAVLSKIISESEQVVHIRYLQIAAGEVSYTNQPIRLQPDHYPVLVFNVLQPGIQLYSDNLLLPVKNNIFTALLQRLQDNLTKRVTATSNHQSEPFLKGSHVGLNHYVSIQSLFPALYRLGVEGIENNASPARKAQVKQLKAYLMFFEQILTGFLAQLAHLDRLFSPAIHTSTATYFSQPLYTVPGADAIIKAFTESNTTWSNFINNPLNDYVKALQQLSEKKEEFSRRKTRILEHLLSRFNIVPDNYPVKLFDAYYSTAVIKGAVSEELQWKSLLLQNILVFNKYRVKATDYFANSYAEEPKSGFAYNMRLLLHLQNKADHYTVQTLHKYLKQVEATDSANQRIETTGTDSSIRTLQADDEEIQVEVNGDISGASVQFAFKHQTIKLFSEGANKKNYRIIHGLDGESNWLVLYKAPQETTWHIVAHFLQRKEAVAALRLFLLKLNRISVETEGFHIVEHLLLAPGLEEKAHGFRFFDQYGNLQFEQAEWLSFTERESIIAEIKEIAAGFDPATQDSSLSALRGLCKLLDGDMNNRKPLSIFERLNLEPDLNLPALMDSVRHWKKDSTIYFPRFQFQIQHKNEVVINEDFFDSRVTVIFPKWPKRFQDENFKQFAENTFRNNLPVHIKPYFLWLDFFEMKQFEQLHIDWTATMRTDDVLARYNATAELRSFILEQIKQETVLIKQI